ncbi:MAG TPA: UDP-N-acetylglucosamine 1-carboxyvinyltransferase [Clostridia bacterium]|nr:UDP-N-acetylglucosamine 1-carboxyvinyltransferase [Clostridia bacterium]
MSRLIVEGGNPLVGEQLVQGAKNSALPVLTSTILCDSPSMIHNCPNLSDVDASCRILSCLGCKVTRDDHSVFVDPSGIQGHDIPDDLMREMRSSIVFLGAICARMGSAHISFPGGCELGPRPIDLHLTALRKLGIQIKEDHGWLNCRVIGKLHGANIVLSFPSVGATENIMLAACTAEGDTVIVNAAREPEISDLADFLNQCGAKVSGAGESVITIRGVQSLTGREHRVIPDRIVAATLMAAAAITGGEITLRNVNPLHLSPVVPVFAEAGCVINEYSDTMVIKRSGPLRPVKYVRTMPYPGFPTDAQAPVMAMSAIAAGTSMFIENIFENRYKHAAELTRLGAKINVEGKVAVVEGVRRLLGAPVEATDLRGGAALVVAALAAEGTTQISGIKHIDRGYENIEGVLSEIGAAIRRE